MKKFLAIYLGSASSVGISQWNAMDQAKRDKLIASGMKAWGDWMTAHKPAIVEQGVPSARPSARLRRESRIPGTT